MHATRRFLASLAAGLVALASLPALAAPSEIRIDWATTNPLSLVLKQNRLLEKEFEADGIAIRWTFSASSNKALELLGAGSLDIASTAGAAALVAGINGIPVKAIGIFSRPEWTALVTRADSGITRIADLRDKTVAVTRGTDAHNFLLRALDGAGLTEHDVKLVLLQPPDGRTALIRKEVDAWAGFDPVMAEAEIADGARLFFRKVEDNTWGVIDTREEFATQNPGIVQRVLSVYEEARQWALANPDALKKLLVAETRLPEAVIARQLERTDMTNTTTPIASAKDSILAAGLALQTAGLIESAIDVRGATDRLIDTRFAISGSRR